MIARKIITFFATEKGRVVSLNCICFAGISLFAAQYIPNTILVNKYKEIIAAYSSGLERTIPDKIQRRFNIAVESCKCTAFEKTFLKPFIAYGFDMLQIGTTNSRFGGLIGIPTNYFYDAVRDIEKGDIQLRHETIKWNSDDGERLQRALVLTEDEQIFGMARSILQVKTHKLILTSLYGPISVFFAYAAGSMVNKRLNLFARPLGLRICLYAIIGIFGYGSYSFATDYTQVTSDIEIDKELCNIGPEFMEAGVRFYDKLLKKNIAIRNLLGNEIYTANGNENYLLRQKSLPLTARKKYVQTKLAEYKKQIEQASDIAQNIN